MAAKTGNINITGTITDRVEIPTANSAFSTTASSIELSTSDCAKTDRRKWQDWRPKRIYCHFQLSVVVDIVGGRWLRAHRARHRQQSHLCRWNFDAVFHSSRDIIISGLAVTLLFPVVHQCRIYLVTFRLSSPWSKILLLPLEITITLNLETLGCMSQHERKILPVSK